MAADALRTAVASVADLCDRQLALIVDEKFSHGLPSNLVFPLDPEHPEAGVRHGFKGMQIACSFFFQAEDGIRDKLVTGVQTCALPISQAGEGCAAQHFSGTLSPPAGEGRAFAARAAYSSGSVVNMRG